IAKEPVRDARAPPHFGNGRGQQRADHPGQGQVQPHCQECASGGGDQTQKNARSVRHEWMLQKKLRRGPEFPARMQCRAEVGRRPGPCPGGSQLNQLAGIDAFRLASLRKSGGTMATRAARIHRVMEILLSNRMEISPLVMDSARRRFCSIMLPSTTPSTMGAIGTFILRRK